MLKRCFFLFVFSLLIISNSNSNSESYNNNKDYYTLNILYDNYSLMKGTKADWGFSCLIQGFEKSILFDTGTSQNILFHNMKEMNIEDSKIELIVISHLHFDHTGGLLGILNKNSNVTVYAPDNFNTTDFKKKNIELKVVNNFTKICDNVYITGGMGDWIIEQAMILDTPMGLVIITGCAHPGIIKILRKVKEMFSKNIYLVIGGLHLIFYTEKQIKEIIGEFRRIGVQKCGVTHCTGDNAIKLFKEVYGNDYIPIGTGMSIVIPK